MSTMVNTKDEFNPHDVFAFKDRPNVEIKISMIIDDLYYLWCTDRGEMTDVILMKNTDFKEQSHKLFKVANGIPKCKERN
ncbi:MULTISPECIES: hypothetical protein [Bacillus subtilis group]|uniref:hypothetical protein n=1 Tax=Bacillus subtilis group TaxID=653685 RepID=UPI001BD02A92|nr:hypothetical protein [Bacillus halotolerans]MCY7883150.1 hypothetical protein [Bacillus spizizenii]MCY8635302.1 hypothetical protein [Bacillus spizizenii]QVN25836.1 hypothetical protein JYG31_11420 [Bacillus halotolerans]UOX38148.1 hypothetical protein [Bacillus phage BUCT083]